MSASTRPTLIVKTGSTVASVRRRRGDFEDWIEAGMHPGAPDARFEVASVFEGDALPEPTSVGGIVVTGSSAMVSHRESWSEKTAAWLRNATEQGVPVLGICYGHQLLAHGCGGEVGPNPRGREVGTVVMRFDSVGDSLLGPLVAGEGRAAFQVTHVESVLRLPDRARRLASSAADPNHAFALGRSAWGVQFHPEFDADVMRGYLDERREVLEAEGFDAAALSAAVCETPAGPELLCRFAQIIEENQ